MGRAHKFTLGAALKHERIHMGRPVTLVDWKRFNIEGIDVLVIFYTTTDSTDSELGPMKTWRMQVFENGKPAVGTIVKTEFKRG